MKYDAAIIGSGHNGLICAAYLARAGLKTLVLERRAYPGGAVCTQEDLIPGCKINVGSSAHIMIHMTPILKDLELEKHGLRYIEMDPWAYYPVQGSSKGISFYKSIDQTCHSIASFSKKDAESYRKFVRHWSELNEGVFETFLEPPSPGKIFWKILKRNLLRPSSRKLWSNLETVRWLMAPYGQLVEESFENPHVKTALLWLAAQSGPAPDEIASGDMLGWNAMIHTSGAKRAEGGSGSLTKALVNYLKSKGSEVLTSSEVLSIRQNDKSWNVIYSQKSAEPAEDTTEEITVPKVIGACHIKTFLGKLMKNCPDPLKKKISHLRVGNGFGMIVRHLVEELPQYSGAKEDHLVRPYHSSLQLLCPSKNYLQSSYRDFINKKPPNQPSVVAMTFSAIDPTLAPENKHLLFTWGQYHPYELGNGEDWKSIEQREADKLYELVCRYAPNMKGKMLDRFIQTPLWIEENLGMLRGNVMHLEMSIDQMFFFRPLPELSCYKTPMKGIYLTGSSTHPGGGVFGASGYNTARTVLADS